MTGTAELHPEVEATLARIESKVDAVVARFEELRTGIEQIDARISRDVAGEAPSVADDLRDLIGPIELLSRRLQEQADDPTSSASETHRAAN